MSVSGFPYDRDTRLLVAQRVGEDGHPVGVVHATERRFTLCGRYTGHTDLGPRGRWVLGLVDGDSGITCKRCRTTLARWRRDAASPICAAPATGIERLRRGR